MGNSIEPNTKEYYQLQSEYWFNECCKCTNACNELINDMAEVKRKAEAWDKLKEEKMNDYKRYSKKLEEAWGFDYITRPIENYLGEMELILKRMDQLDGTHEFQNLLSDLEEQ
ncbi:hypothetical protein MXL63_01325 [Staphylococcus haemolyticus]|uniref:hypothetical protein n=1 Tax=Staphylococcus haemolyticus TaxID=1283 RepID=UPI002DB9EDC6|nr:hypothetical protein [Staphylococcus haemolyticus]MEB6265018.1 hypothetical protein [Staphylococcus haemolyticus]